MMMSKAFLLISLLLQSASAWSVSGGQSSTPSTTKEATTSTTPIPTRRSFLGALATTSSLVSFPNLARSATDEELIDVYFGCGCFWHVQHEFVEAERKILGRLDDEITARAGYAGGKAGALDGKVCYHNAANIADYGKLGGPSSSRLP